MDRSRRLKLLYVSDLHSSEAVLEAATETALRRGVDVLILSGDYRGKAYVPILVDGERVTWPDPVTEEVFEAPGSSVAQVEAAIRARGHYAERIEDTDALPSPDGLAARLDALALESTRTWLERLEEFARRSDVEVIMGAGNDDALALDSLFSERGRVHYCTGRVVNLHGYSFVGVAEVPPTPWSTPRELSERRLAHKLRRLVGAARHPVVLCAHCPPYASGLDAAPKLDDQLRPIVLAGTVQVEPIGSRAVAEVLSAPEVVLGLHGHVHEAPGFARAGGTLCFNPGSEYGQGILGGGPVYARCTSGR